MQISRRNFLGSLLAAPLVRAQAVSKPNIVFVIADDLGWNDLGYQNPEVRTPNIDRLSARGVRFSQYHTNSVCSPTRASLHTGRTAFRVGVPSPIPRTDALPMGEKMLPEYLQGVGYQTWLVGKWHLGDIAPAYLPHRRGYQHHYGFMGGMVDYYTHEGAQNRADWYRNGEIVNEAGYSTDLLADEAIGLINRRERGKPFFLNLSFNAPHTPLQAPEQYLANFAGVANANRRAYLALIEAMDAAIGRVYGVLEAQGIAEDTLFVFVSDNGGQLGAGGASNGALRGAKSGAFEGSLRVPAFALWPGGLEGGWVFDQLFAVMDWLPTLGAIAGFTPDPAVALDGVNMWRYVRDGEGTERGTVILGGGENYALYRGDWKLVDAVPAGGQRQQFLFRIWEDPLEQRDLAGEYPEVLAELREALRAHPFGPPDRAQ